MFTAALPRPDHCTTLLSKWWQHLFESICIQAVWSCRSAVEPYWEAALHDGQDQDAVHNRSREAAAIAICRSGLASCEVTLRTRGPPERVPADVGTMPWHHHPHREPVSSLPTPTRRIWPTKSPDGLAARPGFRCSATGSDQASGRIYGNSSTSRIEAEPVSSMTRRSMPMPRPPVGGRPTSRARI